MTVKVSPEVFMGINAVRNMGVCKMYSIGEVIMVAEMFDYNEAADFVRNNQRDYCLGLSEGFETNA